MVVPPLHAALAKDGKMRIKQMVMLSSKKDHFIQLVLFRRLNVLPTKGLWN
jgi:hypothetical protein